MYNEQTNAHLIDSLLFCSVFITPTCFNANALSLVSSYSVPVKLHKRVHAVLMVFLKEIFTLGFFRIVKTLKLS
jgi:hypothetical protein